MLDPLEPVLRRLVEEWPEIKAPRVTEEPSPTELTRRPFTGPLAALEPAPGAERARRQTVDRVPDRDHGLEL